MGTAKDKLIEGLSGLKRDGILYREDVANFIIEDRKRIVEPLVKLGEVNDRYVIGIVEAINQTLKNAGLE